MADEEGSAAKPRGEERGATLCQHEGMCDGRLTLVGQCAGNGVRRRGRRGGRCIQSARKTPGPHEGRSGSRTRMIRSDNCICRGPCKPSTQHHYFNKRIAIHVIENHMLTSIPIEWKVDPPNRNDVDVASAAGRDSPQLADSLWKRRHVGTAMVDQRASRGCRRGKGVAAEQFRRR